MVRRILLSCVIACSLGAGNAWAHQQEPGRVHPVITTVRINQPVMAGKQPLTPGTYELVVTDDRPSTPSGEPIESQRYVEFVQNGMVIAREIAEVSPASERPVGTSSAARAPKAVVEMLKGDEFVRIAVDDTSARYLIHLPVSRP